MTSRVTFISPAMNAALRQARFDDGGTPLDDSGTAQAGAAAGTLPPAARVFTSPSLRCRRTAEALGLHGAAAPELAGMEMSRWRGRTLDEVSAAEPESVGRWLTDPGCAPHGGESVRAFCDRVARWLTAAQDLDGRTLAVVEPEVVRAAVVHALGMTAAAFWRLDVTPLTATELSGRSGRRAGWPDTSGTARRRRRAARSRTAAGRWPAAGLRDPPLTEPLPATKAAERPFTIGRFRCGDPGHNAGEGKVTAVPSAAPLSI